MCISGPSSPGGVGKLVQLELQEERGRDVAEGMRAPEDLVGTWASTPTFVSLYMHLVDSVGSLLKARCSSRWRVNGLA